MNTKEKNRSSRSTTILTTIITVTVGLILSAIVYLFIFPQDSSFCTDIIPQYRLSFVAIVSLIVGVVVTFIFRSLRIVSGFFCGLAILAMLLLLIIFWCPEPPVVAQNGQALDSGTVATQEVGDLEVSQDKLRDVVTTNLANLAALEEFREKENEVSPKEQAPSIINNYYTTPSEQAPSTLGPTCKKNELLIYDSQWTCIDFEEAWNDPDLSFDALKSEITNTKSGSTIGIFTDGEGNEIQIDETITKFMQNDDGSFTHIAENGEQTELSFAESITKLSNDSTANQLIFTDEDGQTTAIDLSVYLDNTDLLASLGCTDGQGLSWDSSSSTWICNPDLGIDADFYEIGTATPPDDIADNIYTQGDVSIGSALNTQATRLYVEDDITTQTSTDITNVIVDDFDAGLAGGQWTNTTGSTVDNLCGNATGLNALRFSDIASGSVRQAETIDVDTIAGGTITFRLFAPNPTVNADCEIPDPGEGIILEFSNDAGANWIQINTYDATDFTTPTLVSESIPAAAQTAATRIRWRQSAHTSSGTVGYDQWTLDDVVVQVDSGFLYGETVAEIYNANTDSDIDLLRLKSDVGSVGNVQFRVDSDGDVYSDGTSFLGGGADIAEMYENTDDAQAGDVVVYIDQKTVQKSSSQNEAGLAGIVATKPAVVLGAGVQGVPVALSGRVPVKFSLENGSIKRGDYLTSGKDGQAVKAIKAGQTLGTAMEDQEVDGTVEVFVGVGYWAPPVQLSSEQSEITTSGATVIVDSGSTFAELVEETWSITKDFIVSAKVIFEGAVAFLGEVTFMDRVTYADQDAGGSVVISQGLQYATVEFETPFVATPIITITTQEEFVQAIVKDVSVNSFTIAIENSLEKDLMINWVALSVAQESQVDIESDQAVQDSKQRETDVASKEEDVVEKGDQNSVTQDKELNEQETVVLEDSVEKIESENDISEDSVQVVPDESDEISLEKESTQEVMPEVQDEEIEILKQDDAAVPDGGVAVEEQVNSVASEESEREAQRQESHIDQE